jgi:hypothetical protein
MKRNETGMPEVVENKVARDGIGLSAQVDAM